MGGIVVTIGNRHIVFKIKVTKEKLDKVAEALGIPKKERSEFIEEAGSILIYRGDAPDTPGGRRKR
jgi:hypothetical protein